jgi:hypothetical protein
MVIDAVISQSGGLRKRKSPGKGSTILPGLKLVCRLR